LRGFFNPFWLSSALFRQMVVQICSMRSKPWCPEDQPRIHLVRQKKRKTTGEKNSFNMFYPLVNKQFANWKMAMEIVDLPIKNGDVP
jgi:hypothetical protein